MIRSASAFQVVMFPSRSIMKMEWSLMFCTSEVYRDSISRLASSARRRSVVSSMARRMNSVWLSFPQMRRALRSMYFRPMVGKDVFDLEIVERRVLRQDLLQQLPQPGDVPLLVAQVVHQPVHRLFRRDLEGAVERAVGPAAPAGRRSGPASAPARYPRCCRR